MSAGVRTLVIDDDADMLVLLTALLEHLGAAVTTASDAQATRAALLQGTDLILLDLVMPGDSYADIIVALTACKPSATLVLMSGSDSAMLNAERARLATLGLEARHALQKPVRLDALSALLAETAPKR